MFTESSQESLEPKVRGDEISFLLGDKTGLNELYLLMQLTV
jgi:hypothetical protein